MNEINIAKEKLNKGAWYSVEYGFDRTLFCVIAIDGESIVLENPEWLLSASLVLTKDMFFTKHYNPIFVGYGKRRPIAGYIRKNMDCFGTLYTKPKGHKNQKPKQYTIAGIEIK